MRIVLKILFTCLLLVLAVALGTEVAALHRAALPIPARVLPPVVVRKAAYASTPPKTVRPLSGRRRGRAEARRVMARRGKAARG